MNMDYDWQLTSVIKSLFILITDFNYAVDVGKPREDTVEIEYKLPENTKMKKVRNNKLIMIS